MSTFRVIFERDDLDDATPQGFASSTLAADGTFTTSVTWSQAYHNNSDEGAQAMLLAEIADACKHGLRVSDIRYLGRREGAHASDHYPMYFHTLLLDAPFDSIAALVDHLQVVGYDESGIHCWFNVSEMHP